VPTYCIIAQFVLDHQDYTVYNAGMETGTLLFLLMVLWIMGAVSVSLDWRDVVELYREEAQEHGAIAAAIGVIVAAAIFVLVGYPLMTVGRLLLYFGVLVSHGKKAADEVWEVFE